jgi:hypothetical protein
MEHPALISLSPVPQRVGADWGALIAERGRQAQRSSVRMGSHKKASAIFEKTDMRQRLIIILTCALLDRSIG